MKQRVDLLCPICDQEAEFVYASGFAGINRVERFQCHACGVDIRRDCRENGTISMIQVGEPKGSGEDDVETE